LPLAARIHWLAKLLRCHAMQSSSRFTNRNAYVAALTHIKQSSIADPSSSIVLITKITSPRSSPRAEFIQNKEYKKAASSTAAFLQLIHRCSLTTCNRVFQPTHHPFSSEMPPQANRAPLGNDCTSCSRATSTGPSDARTRSPAPPLNERKG
jgi:hypothetical protein